MNRTHLTGLFAATGVNAAKTNCKLHTVTINTKGVAPNLLTLADDAGTIAVIDTSTPGYLLFDLDTIGQLTAASAAGTGADVTFMWE